MKRTRLISTASLAVSSILVLALATQLRANCTLQLSEQGVLHMSSGEQRNVTWNEVPGATSYFTQDVIENLGDPASPDYAFGGAYSESHNGEAPKLTSYPIGHTVLYKITFHLIVTALNRSDPNFVPCSADVRYVVAADPELASISSRRIVPLAGNGNGMNGSHYSTALVVAGSGLAYGLDNNPQTEKLYQGRIYFRALGTRASDSDPSIPYGLDADETVVFDDVMSSLGASGIGSIEIVPRIGFPTPQADAIIENILPDGKRVGSRIPAVRGRDQLMQGETVAVVIRNTADSRLALGVRSYGDLGGFLILQHLTSSGTILETVQRVAVGNTTSLIPLDSLFAAPLQSGDRIMARYSALQFDNLPGTQTFTGGKGVVLFLTETGNALNNPNVVYRDSLDSPHYSNGFQPFLVR